ncbi:hypothetical protein BLGI_2523 [Brevibacillus laterosporus GI-9]|nr:hypothetical protein [Brevibacillus laterosporus]CCF14594.1 hypothetical protein BLGI_2523 [Brevibacillus laterosporus GI-9]
MTEIHRVLAGVCESMHSPLLDREKEEGSWDAVEEVVYSMAAFYGLSLLL